MDIHVVAPGETIESIAGQYGVSVQKIIQDNELKYPDKLIQGQTIVILYPTKTYTVTEGDTLASIAESNGITVMQLLRNNAFLAERENIYPGESLVISYDNNKGKVTISGFAYPYINKKILTKTLPYLTYLSIFNYTITDKGELTTYYDDSEIINITKEYGVAPLMLLTTLTAQGIPNIETSYDILTNEKLLDRYINIVLSLVRAKGYYGVNLSFQYLSKSNLNQHLKLFYRVAEVAYSNGIPLFITVNPNKTYVGNQLVYDDVDYTGFNMEANSIAFLTFDWAYNFGPPLPIGSINEIEELIEYALKYITSEKISVGVPIMGYDWELPYVVGFSKASALTLEAVLDLALEVGAVIEFDELSKTPYFSYTETPMGIRHIVWFIDARSINSLMDLVSEYKLSGTGIWNIMTYYSQMWLVINSQYEIDKVIV